ncbi:hypothetical protein [Raoultibacter phocaeensis]|uniref:hypothetical protein n=1 Tax=Raoultibacter phocaeensis TaxID=2479841 RepID=UPI00111ACA44|nr:hypothetical protein [Raoultibacter phocaeensis]
MDIMVLVVLVIAAFVALEFLGFRAYKRHKAKKEALFTKEQLAEVYDDLQSTRAFCLGAKRAYHELAAQADGAGEKRDAGVLEALAEGEKSHLAELETFRERLRAEAVDAHEMPIADMPIDEALRACARQTDQWAAGPCAEYAARARMRGYGDISRMYKRIQEVESLYAGICLDIAEKSEEGLDGLSRCPSCGTIVAGRRPAFCTVCTQPGFEFVAVEGVEAEAEAQGEAAL